MCFNTSDKKTSAESSTQLFRCLWWG